MILLACLDGGLICGPAALLVAGVALIVTAKAKQKATKKGGAA